MTRPMKHRHGARVVVVADGEVLLMSDSDPGVPGSHWWVTPGGGVDAGETPAAAASRELYEETGLMVSLEDLEGPVARRVAVHGYSDRVLVQAETFYRARVQRTDPVATHLTATEQQRITGMQWWDVEALPEPLWPAGLRDLLEVTHEVDLGVMDESTVPLDEHESEHLAAYVEGLRSRW